VTETLHAQGIVLINWEADGKVALKARSNAPPRSLRTAFSGSSPHALLTRCCRAGVLPQRNALAWRGRGGEGPPGVPGAL